MPKPEANEAVQASAEEQKAARRAARRASKGTPAWDKDRTRKLFAQYKETKDPEVRDQLIVSHLNLVRFLASKFKNRGEPLDDLIQVGTIGLIKAIDRFEPDRGLEFTTYATPTISSKINQVTDDLTKELQRSPSIEEIAQRLDTNVEEILEAMESSSAYSSVPLEGGGSGADGDETPSIIDQYVTEDEDLAGSDDRIVLDEAIRDFSPREQEIIRMRFVEGLTQVEIAEKLNISQVQVSRLLRRTLKRIQEKIDPESVNR